MLPGRRAAHGPSHPNRSDGQRRRALVRDNNFLTAYLRVVRPMAGSTTLFIPKDQASWATRSADGRDTLVDVEGFNDVQLAAPGWLHTNEIRDRSSAATATRPLRRRWRTPGCCSSRGRWIPRVQAGPSTGTETPASKDAAHIVGGFAEVAVAPAASVGGDGMLPGTPDVTAECDPRNPGQRGRRKDLGGCRRVLSRATRTTRSNPVR